MPADSSSIAPRPATARARATNRPGSFSGADGRSAGARLLRDMEAALAAPLGGWSTLTSTERLFVTSAAVLSVRLDQLRNQLANGGPVDDEQATRLAHALRKELAALDHLARAKNAFNPLAAFRAPVTA